jgi:hypothetical protein
MYSSITQENNSKSGVNSVSHKRSEERPTLKFVDNRPEAVAQRELQEKANNSSQVSRLRMFQDMASLGSQLNHSIIQAFAPARYMELSIRNYKSNEKILGQGWDDKKIDDLAGWCKSDNQFNSFINNLSYENWRVLSQDFTGKELPVKIVDSWVTYQKKYMEVKVYKSFEGYKGSGGTSWNTGKSRSDWSGCYIATTREQAEGYIGELGSESGKASMWEISLKQSLPVKVFSGGFIDQSDIPGDFKAKVLKKILKINNSEKLVKELGGQGFAYLGPAGEDGNEMVVPWALIPDYIVYKRIAEYAVNSSHEITSKKDV